ncbi:hypothetical protein BJV74DRAFT_765387 [Russula compacta]|nr:hypothetical protein BJV74DRAFT_765387 [Russula compacta]
MGTSQPALVNVTTPNPDLERGKPDRHRKRSATGGTSGSSSIVQSRYADMVFEEVPRMHNLLSGLFTWIVLAGFVVLPGTFSTLESFPTKSGELEKVLHDVQHLPLLVIAYGCCGVGGLGMLLLWWRWAHNYVWLLNSIFIPGTLNGLSGLISTFASIYGAQGGVYGTASIITLAVTGACMLVCGTLTTIYSVWKLGRVKRLHKREMEQVKTIEIGEKHYIS